MPECVAVRSTAGGVLTFFVPGDPVGKGRPRVGRVAGQARMFTPAKTVAYEGLIALAAHQAAQSAGWECGDSPVAVELIITFSMPASWSAKKRSASAGQWCCKKPDIDNVIKSVADGCNGVLWRDDQQIVRVAAVKRWGDQPGVMVQVERA